MSTVLRRRCLCQCFTYICSPLRQFALDIEPDAVLTCVGERYAFFIGLYRGPRGRPICGFVQRVCFMGWDLDDAGEDPRARGC